MITDIIVNSVNDAPTTSGQSVTLTNNESIDITLTSTDVENDNLTYTIVDNDR